MYKVIRYFTDLQDSNHAYNAGDEYPREGLSPTAERFAELAGSNNKQGVPLIREETAGTVTNVTESAENAESGESDEKRTAKKRRGGNK